MNEKFNLQELTESDIQDIGMALMHLPMGRVRSLVERIERQVAAQMQVAHDKAADEADRPSGARVRRK